MATPISVKRGYSSVAQRCDMTEHEWLACTNPAPMLEFLRRKNSDLFDSLFDKSRPVAKDVRGYTGNRKLRLFVSACARRVWNLLEEHSRKVVEVRGASR